jgi:hypothetical protein
MKFSAVTLVGLAAGAIAAPAPVPAAEAAPVAAPEAAPGSYAGYGSYKGAGEGLKSYPHYGNYGKKPIAKPASKYSSYGEWLHEYALVQPLTPLQEATTTRNTQSTAIISVRPRPRPRLKRLLKQLLKQPPKQPLKQEAILDTGRIKEQARD